MFMCLSMRVDVSMHQMDPSEGGMLHCFLCALCFAEVLSRLGAPSLRVRLSLSLSVRPHRTPLLFLISVNSRGRGEFQLCARLHGGADPSTRQLGCGVQGCSRTRSHSRRALKGFLAARLFCVFGSVVTFHGRYARVRVGVRAGDSRCLVSARGVLQRWCACLPSRSQRRRCVRGEGGML